jgi:uroporphyrinogen decarboxylase
MSLNGKKILVTRATEKGEEFARLIEAKGGIPVLAPTIEITDPDSWEPCDRAILGLHIYGGLIFTSANGVEYFMKRLRSRGHPKQEDLTAELRSKTILAVGEKTREALRRNGVGVTMVPERFTAVNLAREVDPALIHRKLFLFIRGNKGADVFTEAFSQLGGSVDSIIVYNTRIPRGEAIDAVRTLLRSGEIDIATFTSPSTFENFSELFSQPDFLEFTKSLTIAAIGPVTGEAIAERGLDVHIEAGESTIESLLAGIEEYFSAASGHRRPPARGRKHNVASTRARQSILKKGERSSLLVSACFRRPTGRTPVWIMRQAGRYLPEYRAVRAKVDFLTLCKTPELAAEVTIQPVDIIGVDAAIIFSDILVVPEAMGMELVVEEGKGGPRFPSPIKTPGDIGKLREPDPNVHLKFVMDALALTRKNLKERVPLIGFSGSPWTLAAYMVDGHGAKDFPAIRKMMAEDPGMVHTLLGKLASSVAAYLSAQIEAGAQVVQIFDTWGGILPKEEFLEYSLQYIEQIIAEVRTGGAPVIVFCKDCGHSLEEIADSGCNVVGLDASTDIGNAGRRIGGRVALQGNMKPEMLYESAEAIRAEVRLILEKFGHRPGHVFNLGHGIHPDVPVDHVITFVKAVKEESVNYHSPAA